MVCIYRITSPSGKIYIGQTINLKNRIKQYRFLNCKSQTKLLNSLKKYGFDSHQVDAIHYLPPDTEKNIVDIYEVYYISTFKAAGFTMLNIENGGNGKGKHSDETKAKISRSNKGRPGPFKGKFLSIEHRKKLSERTKRQWNEGNVGLKHHSEQIKRVLSEKHKGKKVSVETRIKLSEAHKGEKHNNYGKQLPEGTRLKISLATMGRTGSMKGKKFSEDHKYKISVAKRGKYNGKVGEDKENAKLTNEQAKDVFNSEMSSRKLAKLYNVNKSTILRIKSGKYWKQINNVTL